MVIATDKIQVLSVIRKWYTLKLYKVCYQNLIKIMKSLLILVSFYTPQNITKAEIFLKFSVTFNYLTNTILTVMLLHRL